MIFGIVELYQGDSGKQGYYNSQELGLARAMRKLGCEVIVFYPDSKSKSRYENMTDDGIKVVYCPSRNVGVHSWYNWNVLKEYKVDLVQVGADNQLFAPDLLRYCKENGILAYCYLGVLNSDTDSKLKQYIMKMLLRRNISAYKNIKCFVKTENIQRQLKEYGIANSEVAYVGLDESVIPVIEEGKYDLRRQYGVPENTTVITFVGRIDEYKRPFELLKVLSGLRKKNIKYKAFVIGTGKLDEPFEIKLKDAHLSDDVTWIKKIPNREIHKFYKMADFYLNFNEKEIFGMGILEAMNQGCTAIAMHAPGPDSIIENGTNSYLVDTISEMMDIIEKRETLDTNVVRSSVKDKFTWDSTAWKIHNYLMNLEK